MSKKIHERLANICLNLTSRAIIESPTIGLNDKLLISTIYQLLEPKIFKPIDMIKNDVTGMEFK